MLPSFLKSLGAPGIPVPSALLHHLRTDKIHASFKHILLHCSCDLFNYSNFQLLFTMALKKYVSIKLLRLNLIAVLIHQMMTGH